MDLDLEVREFIIEGNEYVAMLDRDIIALEDDPDDHELISSAFRAIHTIKGTCGFFGYDILGSVTHLAENIPSQVRERERPMTSELVSLILETLDAVKILLQNIESSGREGADFTEPLRLKLEAASSHSGPSGNLHADATAEPPGSTPPYGVEASFESVGQGNHVGPLNRVTQNEASSAVLLAADEPTDIAVGLLAVPRGSSAPVLAAATFEALKGEPVHAETLNCEGASLTGQDQLAAGASTPEGSFGAIQDHVVEPMQDIRDAAAKEAQLADSTIRVDVALLNRLMNLVGELVLARNQLLQESSTLNTSLLQTSQRLNLITSELQEGVMKTRMQPIGVVWNKLPRVVRDLAAKCGKRVRIEMEGAETELDKTIIEAIKDPLTHIVRNSCDHGIETPDVRKHKGKKAEGVLQLRAYHEGGVVNIEISDDGAGIDPQRVKVKALEKGLIRADQAALMSDRDASHLIFLPGFSTAAQITSVSGRGVGMDVVKTNIEKIGGNVELLNRPEGGTTIRIKIPLTLAIIPGLVVALHTSGVPAGIGPRWSKKERFIIPQANLLELVHIEAPELKRRIENVHGTPVFHHRGKLLPLVYLGRVLGKTEEPESAEAANIIVLQAENKQLGLVVDSISDTQEIVVKPLGRQLKGLSCYVGATIMGDGRPALILDVSGLARLAGLGHLGRQTTQVHAVASTTSNTIQPQMMLLFRAGHFERVAVPLALVDRLEEIPVSRIEHSGGRPVLHYRGEILSLVSMNDMSGAMRSATDEHGDTVQIIVFSNGRRRIGLIVDRILDIVNEAITVRRQTSARGLVGSAVIGGKITDLLDLHSLVKSTGDDWLGAAQPPASEKPRLILIDDSYVAREILCDFLTASGFEVVHAGTVVEAMSKYRQQPNWCALLISTRTFNPDKVRLLEQLRDERVLGDVPVIELLDGPEQLEQTSTLIAQVVRSDINALLDTLMRSRQNSRPVEVHS